MKLSEAPIGLRVCSVDNTFGDEVRWVHYERRFGVAHFTTNPDKPTAFVTAYRLRCVQGVPGERPRYDSGESKVPTEVDGRIEVIPATEIDHDAWQREVKPIRYLPDLDALEALAIKARDDAALALSYGGPTTVPVSVTEFHRMADPDAVLALIKALRCA